MIYLVEWKNYRRLEVHEYSHKGLSSCHSGHVVMFAIAHLLSFDSFFFSRF
jgi:hypothetical protein